VPGRGLNGEYDGPNGVWDAYTQIWATTRIVYSGETEFEDSLFWRGAPLIPQLSPPPTYALTIDESGVLLFKPIDAYGNSLSSGLSINVSTDCERAEPVVSETFGDWYGNVEVG